MRIYLGVASFLRFLEDSKKDYRLQGSDLSIIALWLPLNSIPSVQPFEISAEYREPDNCGFIATTEETLRKAFGKKDYNFILQNCKKEDCNKEDCKDESADDRDRPVSHCPVSLDDARRGNIPVEKDEKDFNCRLAPLFLANR